MTYLKVEGLEKKFSDKPILKNINFEIKAGKMVALLGANAAGKTTLLRCIAGLEQIDSGDILFESDSENGEVVYVFDNPVLYDNLTAEEHLKFVLDINDIKGKDVQAIIGKFGITEYKDKKIMDCSLGMRKRIQLMCAMVLEPKVLLMDEYVSGLDPMSLRDMKEILKEYVAHGNLIVLATHILSVAESFCDSVIYMHDGQVIEYFEDISEVKNKYDSLEEFYFSCSRKGG